MTGPNQVWCSGTPPHGNHIPQFVILKPLDVPGLGRVRVGHCPQCGKEHIRYD